jgi:UDP-N-acetylmuramoyl-L-alanyl-D-glutamate--2,6-diaminopimelate ligase
MNTVLSSTEAARWLASKVSGTLRTDSRQVQRGDGFIAWPGYAQDGRKYVAQALQAGASACLVEAANVEGYGFTDDKVATLLGLKAACGEVADLYYGQPSRQLDVVASTGTNGKTSTTWWTAMALAAVGRRCGVIGTLGIGEPPSAVEFTGLTTPDPVTLHRALRTFVDQGYAACAMEASSIGIAEHRLGAARIKLALFTNFTQDHLDYHGSMAGYWRAKRALFNWAGLQAAVINVDDPQGAELAAELQERPLDVWTVSLRGSARLQGRNLRYENGGLAFDLDDGVVVRSTLVGAFNASNLLVVIGGLRALGVPLADAAAAVGTLTPVPGRLQRVAARDLEVVVDYAHTPDALEKTLQALRPLAAARGGSLWCLFGCGGNRDAGKRPLMGAIAAAQADRIVITSDNPRDEDPDMILAQILAGAKTARSVADDIAVIEDRRAAIQHAVGQARAGDVLLLAGKGHEDYQEVAGVKRPFSDLDEARAALVQREGGTP